MIYSFSAEKEETFPLKWLFSQEEKIIPLRSSPWREPRSNSQSSWDSWSQGPGIDLEWVSLCPCRRQACQMVKAIYHLHFLRGSAITKPCWFLELREAYGGFPRVLIFIQAAICSQDWPSTFRSLFLQNLAIPNILAQTQWFPNTLDLLQHYIYAF